MKVKKIKRICGVRGCKNTANVYALSKTREMGNSVIMCSDCMKDALASIENLEVAVPSVAEKEPEPVEVIETVTEASHISVAEDTVTITKEADKPKTTANAKKKPNKKK